jgi:AbiU2
MMNPVIADLQKWVQAAQEEFDLAVVFHEIWKPAAYDAGLHARTGTSYATQTFRVVNTALRREMIMALMRVWDNSKKDNLRMEDIGRKISKRTVMNALVTECAIRMGIAGAEAEIRSTLDEKAAQVARIVAKYGQGGSRHSVFNMIRHLRDKRLAHRDLAPATATRPSVDDEDIEEFFQDNSVLIQALVGLVNRMAYNPSDTARVFRHYANHFWADVRGERTEGHPHVHAPPNPPGQGCEG